jgi:hypothetical protein
MRLAISRMVTASTPRDTNNSRAESIINVRNCWRSTSVFSFGGIMTNNNLTVLI